MKSKREVFLAGALVGALLMLGMSISGDIYKKFAWDGHQTFEIVIANNLFEEGVVEPKDVRAVMNKCGETTRWVLSRAKPMKNKVGLKKLSFFLDEFVKYDEKYYLQWLEKRHSEDNRKKFVF